MYGQASPPHGVAHQALVTAQSAGPPSLWRRVAVGVGRVVAGTAIVVAGFLAGALVHATEPWIPLRPRTSLALAVAIAVWFTAGRGWLRPRKWPRLLTVFVISGIVALLASWTFLKWAGLP